MANGIKKKADNTAVTADDLRRWMRTSVGRDAMAHVSPGEVATYALGAGVGGASGYGLHRLLTRNRTKAGSLLWSLIGAGTGAAGAHLVLNAPTNNSTKLTLKDRLRVSNAYNTNPKVKKMYDALAADKEPSAVGSFLGSGVRLAFNHPYWTFVPTGGGIGLYSGTRSGNAAATEFENSMHKGLLKRIKQGLDAEARAKKAPFNQADAEAAAFAQRGVNINGTQSGVNQADLEAIDYARKMTQQREGALMPGVAPWQRLKALFNSVRSNPRAVPGAIADRARDLYSGMRTNGVRNTIRGGVSNISGHAHDAYTNLMDPQFGRNGIAPVTVVSGENNPEISMPKINDKFVASLKRRHKASGTVKGLAVGLGTAMLLDSIRRATVQE